MQIIGVDAADRALWTSGLEHGSDPELVAYRHGYRTVRPIDAVRDSTGDIVLRLRVQPAGDGAAPVIPSRGRDRGLEIPDGVTPEVRQRFAAYAVVRSELGLLATEYSDRTAVNGRWGMPGGGIDDGEQPADAVLREVVEETDQHVELRDLVKVQTSHWVGRSPRGTIEDFHAVRLIYTATCPAPSEPVVVDLGGTTESARWVPVDSWSSLPWTVNWRLVLGELLASPAP
jgi:8-oxo-dGTP pyrophosphatase MutT (NUDIX family)